MLLPAGPIPVAGVSPFLLFCAARTRSLAGME